MKPISFKEVNVTYGKGQEEYIPLPGRKETHEWGAPFTTCWKLDFIERVKVLFSGKVWLTQLTFDQNLQPVRMTVYKEEVVEVVKNTLKKGMIEFEGYRYWYEYKEAKPRMSMCLDTVDPREGCDGIYIYSPEDPKKGKAFVVTRTDNTDLFWKLMAEAQENKAHL